MAQPKSEQRLKLEQQLFDRQKIYRDVLNLEAPQVLKLLEDLAEFCYAHKSAFHADARMHAVLEGRREVWLRIQEHLNLDNFKLWELYTRTKY